LAPALVVSVTPRYSLRIFPDLGYLVRHQTMRLAVDGHRRFLVRSFRKAGEGVGRNLRAFGLPFGTTRAADQEEGARQDDYEARHNPQFGEQVLKLSCATSSLDLGGDQ
jgi:hypothetical protein